MALNEILADLKAGKLTEATAALESAAAAEAASAPGAPQASAAPPEPREPFSVVADLFEGIIGLLGNHSSLTGLFDELKSVI